MNKKEPRPQRKYKARERPYRIAQELCAKTKGNELAKVHEQVTEAIAEGASIIAKKEGEETIIFKG